MRWPILLSRCRMTSIESRSKRQSGAAGARWWPMSTEKRPEVQKNGCVTFNRTLINRTSFLHRFSPLFGRSRLSANGPLKRSFFRTVFRQFRARISIQSTNTNLTLVRYTSTTCGTTQQWVAARGPRAMTYCVTGRAWRVHCPHANNQLTAQVPQSAPKTAPPRRIIVKAATGRRRPALDVLLGSIESATGRLTPEGSRAARFCWFWYGVLNECSVSSVVT